jgi:hypothetical protein
MVAENNTSNSMIGFFGFTCLQFIPINLNKKGGPVTGAALFNPSILILKVIS